MHCKRTFTDHRRTESEIRLVKMDGNRAVVRIKSVIARGDPTQLIVMLDNITEQHQLGARQQENTVQNGLQRRLIEQNEMERGSWRQPARWSDPGQGKYGLFDPDHQGHPPILSGLGLRRAIMENVEDLQTKNPQTRINLDLGDDLNSLPDDIRWHFTGSIIRQ